MLSADPQPPATLYRLTPRALDDLDGIWRYTAQTWSITRADRYVDELARLFDLLATMPNLGKLHAEFSPPVRIHVHETHLVIYVLDDTNNIVIIRILGGAQDWVSILKAADV